MDLLDKSIICGLMLGMAHGLVQPVGAVPVVPNFTQGSMTSHTETTSKITETINSIDYNTGWQYSVTGSGLSHSGNVALPSTQSNIDVKTLNGSVSGVSSTQSSLNFGARGTYTLTAPGGSFQFTETYQGPGISNQTIIQRTTEIQSVTDTTSVFTQ